MNMKKKIATLGIVGAMLLTSAGATLAYFTDNETAKNVMTMGNVDIEQIEQERGEDGTLQAFTQNKILVPMVTGSTLSEEEVTVNGDSFKVFADKNAMDKIVTVKNNGNTPAYVRTIVALEAGKTAEEAEILWNDDNIDITDNSGEGEDAVTCVDNDMFVKIGDDYYIILVYTYSEALAAGTESEASLTGVGLSKETTQDDMKNFGGDYEVLVVSQAVQAKGFDENDDNVATTALNAAFGEVTAEKVAEWFADVQ